MPAVGSGSATGSVGSGSATGGAGGAGISLPLPADSVLYPHAFTAYREVEVLAEDGQPAASTVLTAVSDSPCFFEEGQSQQGTQGGFLRGETDNMFTYDTVRMHLGRDVQAQDVLVQVRGPDTGRYYRVEGNPQKFPHLGLYQEVLCAKLEARPGWVPG